MKIYNLSVQLNSRHLDQEYLQSLFYQQHYIHQFDIDYLYLFLCLRRLFQEYHGLLLLFQRK